MFAIILKFLNIFKSMRDSCGPLWMSWRAACGSQAAGWTAMHYTFDGLQLSASHLQDMCLIAAILGRLLETFIFFRVTM